MIRGVLTGCIRRGNLMAGFARGRNSQINQSKDFSKMAKEGNSAVVDSILEDADLNALAKAPKIKERIIVESFKDKTDRIRREKEEKIMNLEFSELTSNLKDGKLDVKQIQLDSVEREKKKLMSHAVEHFDIKSPKEPTEDKPDAQVISVLKKKSTLSPKAARTLNKLQTLDQIRTDLTENNLPENLAFPWHFNFGGQENTQKPEQNLKSVIPIESLITHEAMSTLFKNFVTFWASQDWEILEDFAEPLFVKMMRKEMLLLPSKYQLKVTNLKTAKMEFDLYDVRNIYMSAANVNRKKADSLQNFHASVEDQAGTPVHMLSKKKPDQDDVAGVVAQFSLNVLTNLCVQVVDTHTQRVVASDFSDNGTKRTIHDVKVEILLASVRSSTLKRVATMSAAEARNRLTGVSNHAHARNLRVIDVDGFMRGNPLLGGFDVVGSGVGVVSHPELSSLKRQQDEMASALVGKAAAVGDRRV